MKRRLFKLTLFLFLGVVVNTAIAWSCAIWSNPNLGFGNLLSVSKDEVEQLKKAGWNPTPENAYWKYQHAKFNWRGYGVSEFYIIEIPIPKQPTDIIGMFSFEFYIASIKQAGWPMQCMSSEHVDPSGNGLAANSGYGIYAQLGKGTATFPEIRSWKPAQNTFSLGTAIDSRKLTPIEDWQHSMSLHVPGKIGPIKLPTDCYLPLRPIWSGFIINSLVYATILWLMMLIASMSRQHRRFKKGHCPKCNYELKRDYSTGCPECGWGRGEIS